MAQVYQLTDERRNLLLGHKIRPKRHDNFITALPAVAGKKILPEGDGIFCVSKANIVSYEDISKDILSVSLVLGIST